MISKLHTGAKMLCMCLLISIVAAQTEDDNPEAAADPEAEPEPMFGTLDYILLAAIGAAGIWWFFFRDSEGDKIPEVSFSPLAELKWYYLMYYFLV